MNQKIRRSVLVRWFVIASLSGIWIDFLTGRTDDTLSTSLFVLIFLQNLFVYLSIRYAINKNRNPDVFGVLGLFIVPIVMSVITVLFLPFTP